MPPLYLIPLAEIVSIKIGLFHYQLLSHPISRSTPKDYPPTPSTEPIVPFLLGKIIISQFSSEKTVYLLILRHHHSQHSSPHHQRAHFPSQKWLFNYKLLYHPISRAKTAVYPPTPSAEPIFPFLLVKIIISLFSSEYIVYLLILHHHHIQHSSSHQQRAYYPIQKGLLHYQFLSQPIT